MSGTTKDWLEYHETPVTLHSGGRSHWLVRADMIFADTELREAVLAEWSRLLGYHGGYREFVGIERGGAVWAEAMAEKTRGKYHNLSVAQLKDYGCLFRPEYNRNGEPEHPLVVVDDVATTGASLALVPNATDRLVVVNRCLDRSRQDIMAWAHIPLPVLLD